MQAGRLYQALLDPACYPETPRRVFARDTHVSRLYFTPHYVYKLKKPVNFGFLDFTSLDRRRFFCDEEKRLNQPFAPDTYLGTVAIRENRGRIQVAARQGTIIDYAVKMRRLPQAYMLDRKIRRMSPDLTREIERLVPVLTRMFKDFPTVNDLNAEELYHRLAFNSRENIAQTEPFCDRLVARSAWQQLSAYTEEVLSDNGLKARFLKRASEGLIREGHGDLHSEHICLTTPIRIYDCIEFNRRFRINDLLSELAFLLMDLDYKGRHDLARLIMSGFSGLPKGFHDPDVLRYFLIYRAWVRGKVAALTSRDQHLAPQTKNAAIISAHRHFALALGYLCRPFLAITCGLMGSGKSTLATALAGSTNARLIRSDQVRKQLQGLPDDWHDHSDYAQGLYSKGITAQTYDSMLELAEDSLRKGQPVVVDASFKEVKQRARFEALAKQLVKPFVVVWPSTSHRNLLTRLAARYSRSEDISDGRPELLSAQKSDFDYPKDDEIIEKIDSEREVDYNVQLVLSRILTDHGWQP